jgi:hypothetical protein
MAKQAKHTESKKSSVSTDNQKTEQTSSAQFAFGKQNYKLLFIGLALILIGFLLMIGGGADDPNEFSDDIFDFRRITLAPLFILAGYVVEIFAIMKKPKD